MSNTTASITVDGVDIKMESSDNHKNGHKNYFYLDNNQKKHYKEHLTTEVQDTFLGSDQVFLNDAVESWSNGNSVDSSGDDSSLAKMEQWATWFSADQLDAFCEAGDISQDLCNALKAMSIFEQCGYSGNDLQTMMINFEAMSDEDKAAFVALDDDEEMEITGDDYVTTGTDTYELSAHITSDPTEQQQLACIYLLNSSTSDIEATASQDEDPSAFEQFINLSFEGSYDATNDTYSDELEYINGIDDWTTLGDTTTDYLETIAKGMPDIYDAAQSADDDDVSDDSSESSDVTFTAADFVASGAVDEFVAEVGDIPDDPDELKAMLTADCPTFTALSEDDQDEIVTWMIAASDPNNVVDEDGNVYTKATDANGNTEFDDDGNVVWELVEAAPQAEAMWNSGVSFEDSMNIGCLMFMVLMDRMDAQTDIIEEYTDATDEKNSILADANAALSALRTAQSAADGDDIDLSDITFEPDSDDYDDYTDSDGEMTLYDYVNLINSDNGGDLALSSDFDLKDLSDTEVTALISSLDDYATEKSTDSQSAYQTLSEESGRYTSTSELLSNFISTWSSGHMSIIANLKN
ncbi:MAG: hypothetical protein AAF968_06770 [Pseudomonadota bacterium]